MTTWMLVIFMCGTCNSAQNVVVSGLPTYTECVRIQEEIIKVAEAANVNYGFSRASKCIEVKR